MNDDFESKGSKALWPFERTRVLIGADFHCGHRVGLTPPEWWANPSSKFHNFQKEMWEEFENAIKQLQPIDYFLGNGDYIDGSGIRSGGTELITTDRKEQARMAISCIERVGAKKHAFTFGTPYHGGTIEDFEEDVADYFGSPISGQEQYNIDGVIFDLKHKVGSSTIPHGRATAIMKENLWNALWSEHEEQERAQIIIRSHVHYYVMVEESMWTGIITPALQGQGTKFGSRQCSGHVDFGLVWVDIYEDGGFECGKFIIPLKSHKRKAVVL